MLGQVIGERYKLLYFLGGGGFGHAYFAIDQACSEESWCLVKQMSFGGSLSSMSREERIQRFRQEAETLKLLGQHDRIPSLHNYFEENGQFYLVEDFIDGHEIEEELSNFKFSEHEVYFLIKDILETVAFIHENKVIHRDITPENLIRRCTDRRVVLIDFGAVKRISTSGNNKLFRSETISIGKEVYMPDEQALGRPQPCSDIYAVGVIAIRALIGDLPQKDYDSGELLWRHESIVNSELASIISRMTSHNWRDRYQKAGEVLLALNSIYSEIGRPSSYRVYKPNYAKNWYIRANELRNKGLHEEAIVLYRKAIQMKENFYKALFNIGVTFSYIQDYPSAIEYYDKALVVRPRSSEALLHKGIALYMSNRLTEASQVFSAALAIANTNKATRIHTHYTDLLNLDNDEFS